jgi:lipopolysaccharide/colanic/teichoic acid biosynthesis glycosyltransferase
MLDERSESPGHLEGRRRQAAVTPEKHLLAANFNVRTSISDATHGTARFGGVAKRGFDIIVASALLFTLLPTFLLVSIAVKLSSQGPVLTSVARRGFRKKHISVLKFRTTIKDAACSETAPEKARLEASQTLIGRILHGTGIEWLPMLINVLLGDLSIVGPTPFIPEPVDDLEQTICFILGRVKPGIVGWAQANGHRHEDFSYQTLKSRVELETFYSERQSFVFDIQIIAKALIAKLVYNPN